MFYFWHQDKLFVAENYWNFRFFSVVNIKDSRNQLYVDCKILLRLIFTGILIVTYHREPFESNWLRIKFTLVQLFCIIFCVAYQKEWLDINQLQCYQDFLTIHKYQLSNIRIWLANIIDTRVSSPKDNFSVTYHNISKLTRKNISQY